MLHLHEGSDMLTKLLPEQIAKFWPIIKYAVEESLPPLAKDHPDKMSRILSSALSGSIDVWVAYTRGDKIKVEGIILTTFTHDEVSGTKSMLIYCLYGYEVISGSSWIEGIKSLKKYAKSKKCSRIIAYSSNSNVIEIARRLGANAEYTFLSFDI